MRPLDENSYHGITTRPRIGPRTDIVLARNMIIVKMSIPVGSTICERRTYPSLGWILAKSLARTSTAPALGIRGCPRRCRHQAARRKLALLTRSSNSQPSLAIRQRLRESGFSRWSSFCISSATSTSRFMPSTTTTRVATGSRVVTTGFGAGNLHHDGKSDRQIVSKSAETLGLCRGWLSQKLSHGTPAWETVFNRR